jgi:hypothetical protein
MTVMVLIAGDEANIYPTSENENPSVCPRSDGTKTKLERRRWSFGEKIKFICLCATSATLPPNQKHPSADPDPRLRIRICLWLCLISDSPAAQVKV